MEFPVIFTYWARELHDPSSGWWFVAYTKFAANTAAFLLAEVVDCFHLWSSSPEMIANRKRLALCHVVKSRANVD